jgi:hypothetical protein
VDFSRKSCDILIVLWDFKVIPVDAGTIDIPQQNNRFEPGPSSFRRPYSVFGWKLSDLKRIL